MSDALAKNSKRLQRILAQAKEPEYKARQSTQLGSFLPVNSENINPQIAPTPTQIPQPTSFKRIVNIQGPKRTNADPPVALGRKSDDSNQNQKAKQEKKSKKRKAPDDPKSLTELLAIGNQGERKKPKLNVVVDAAKRKSSTGHQVKIPTDEELDEIRKKHYESRGHEVKIPTQAELDEIRRKHYEKMES